MKQFIKGQQGLTLVEVLLSIVLLAIILTSFMGFFTQSAIFTAHNEEKLNTMQTVQKYINKIESGKVKIGQTNLEKGELEPVIEELLGSSTFTYTNGNKVRGFITEIEGYMVKGNFKEVEIDVSDSTEKLIQFEITVSDKKDNKNKSTTYTYIKKIES